MSTQNQEARDSVVVYHPDSRSMRLAPKAEWPQDGILIRSCATPALARILWLPEGDPAKPWVVQTYLEWGVDWNARWSCRLSTEHLRIAFGPVGQGELALWGYFLRGHNVVTFALTHLLEIKNGDPFCQIFLTDDMVKAVEELVEQHVPKLIQATA